MFEWLEGYWTAMRHVANAAPQAGQEPHWTAVVTAWGAIAAVLVSIVAACLTWVLANRSMRQTADAYHKDQRPWISANLKIVGDLSYERPKDKTLLIMRLELKIKNTGRSAAIVEFEPEYYLNNDPKCLSLPEGWPKENEHSYSISPEETVTINPRFRMLKSTVDECLKKYGVEFHPVIILNIAYRETNSTKNVWFSKRRYVVWKKKNIHGISEFNKNDIMGPKGKSIKVDNKCLCLRSGHSNSN